jgi:hypothetical protein
LSGSINVADAHAGTRHACLFGGGSEQFLIPSSRHVSANYMAGEFRSQEGQLSAKAANSTESFAFLLMAQEKAPSKLK